LRINYFFATKWLIFTWNLIQLYHLPRPTSPTADSKAVKLEAQVLRFKTLDTSPLSHQSGGRGTQRVVHDAFLAASENGFAFRQGSEGERSWRCTLPGTVATLEFT